MNRLINIRSTLNAKSKLCILKLKFSAAPMGKCKYKSRSNRKLFGSIKNNYLSYLKEIEQLSDGTFETFLKKVNLMKKW